jgi:hypothetical protein
MVACALLGFALPFLLGPRARILTSAMPRSTTGILAAFVFALFGAAYGWVVGELFVHTMYGRDDSTDS